MADEELAALRQQRLAELQAKHGVRRGALHAAAPGGQGSGAGRGGTASP
uniref:Programmed cell death 5 n=1 Tax=Pavo cristatus TaxID=9049 RepID=A0A8C9F1P6_PAVCR